MTLRDDQLARVFGGKFERAKGDHCTLAADGWWGGACDDHDVEYAEGGSAEQRKAADRRLRDNMIKRDAPPLIAKAYELGVSIGGSPLLPTPWRWGFLKGK